MAHFLFLLALPQQSHEIDQPENQPSKQAQRNEGTRPINGPAQ